MASASRRGIHNIRDSLMCPNWSDLAIHDSTGLELGDDNELRQLTKFIADRSNSTDMKDRLHVIWFVNQDLLYFSTSAKLRAFVGSA